LVDAHFINVFVLLGVYWLLMFMFVDVPICTYLLSRLFKIKGQVDVHVL
jgi:hypothetical protein